MISSSRWSHLSVLQRFQNCSCFPFSDFSSIVAIFESVSQSQHASLYLQFHHGTSNMWIKKSTSWCPKTFERCPIVCHHDCFALTQWMKFKLNHHCYNTEEDPLHYLVELMLKSCGSHAALLKDLEREIGWLKFSQPISRFWFKKKSNRILSLKEEDVKHSQLAKFSLFTKVSGSMMAF